MILSSYPRDFSLSGLTWGPLAMWWAANKPPTLPEGGCPPNRLPHGHPCQAPRKFPAVVQNRSIFTSRAVRQLLSFELRSDH